jgi:hypothetical protein
MPPITWPHVFSSTDSSGSSLNKELRQALAYGGVGHRLYHGKPRRYLFDFLEWHTKPRIYCGMEWDSQQKAMYLKEDQPECI